MQIVVEDLHRTYPTGQKQLAALCGISLSIDRGEYVALTGPSGSGKSTLLHLIGCLDRPTAGCYHLEGRAVESLSDEALSALRNQTIGFVFQAFYLIPELDVRENVEVPLVYRGVGPAERSARAVRALQSVGLGSHAARRPSQLSGGELQRVAIARAIVGEPAIVLADEPTGNLDSRTGDEVTELLEALHARGTTLIVVTHDSRRAARAERELRLCDGRIAC